MMRSPTFEAEFAHDSRSPLTLYDCLIPKLREHRKLELCQEMFTNSTLLSDIKAQRNAIQLQKDLEKK